MMGSDGKKVFKKSDKEMLETFTNAGVTLIGAIMPDGSRYRRPEF